MDRNYNPKTELETDAISQGIARVRMKQMMNVGDLYVRLRDAMEWDYLRIDRTDPTGRNAARNLASSYHNKACLAYGRAEEYVMESGDGIKDGPE